MLGGLFVVSTVYLPKGVVGIYRQYSERKAAKSAQAGQLADADESESEASV